MTTRGHEVIAGYEGSARSAEALDWAVRDARLRGLPLTGPACLPQRQTGRSLMLRLRFLLQRRHSGSARGPKSSVLGTVVVGKHQPGRAATGTKTTKAAITLISCDRPPAAVTT
jgi:hypothetical protein